MSNTKTAKLVVMGDVEAPGLYIRGEGTDNSQSITEQGPTAHTLTVANDTKYENTVKLPWATTSIYFDDASLPVTSAPSLLRGSHTRPPPQPISNIFKAERGFSSFFFNLK